MSDEGLANWEERQQKKAGRDLFHLTMERYGLFCWRSSVKGTGIQRYEIEILLLVS
jgi:hypothetical protein